jgi:RecA/RadA recombinase
MRRKAMTAETTPEEEEYYRQQSELMEAAIDEEAKAKGYPSGTFMLEALYEAEIRRGVAKESSPGIFDYDGITSYDTEGLDQLPDGEWLIDGVLPAQSISFVYGNTGSMKTFFALDMALSLAAGVDFLGRKVQPVPVAFFYL